MIPRDSPFLITGEYCHRNDNQNAIYITRFNNFEIYATKSSSKTPNSLMPADSFAVFGSALIYIAYGTIVLYESEFKKHHILAKTADIEKQINYNGEYESARIIDFTCNRFAVLIGDQILIYELPNFDIVKNSVRNYAEHLLDDKIKNKLPVGFRCIGDDKCKNQHINLLSRFTLSKPKSDIIGVRNIYSGIFLHRNIRDGNDYIYLIIDETITKYKYFANTNVMKNFARFSPEDKKLILTIFHVMRQLPRFVIGVIIDKLFEMKIIII